MKFFASNLFVLFLLMMFKVSNAACFQRKQNTTSPLVKVKSTPSSDGQWPFLASFISIPERDYLNTNKSYIPEEEHYSCTGIIVGYRWILTSYQCVYPLFSLDNYTTVFTGSSKSLSGTAHALKHYRLFNNLYPYQPWGIDIALLELDDYIYNDNVTEPIQIASEDEFVVENETNATIVGYSWYRDANDTSITHDARHSPISLLPSDECKDKGPEYEICVGGDVDEGDDVKYQVNDASAIVTEIDGTYKLIGMVVRPSENTDGFHAIATFLPKWCDWIKITTAEEVTCE